MTLAAARTMLRPWGMTITRTEHDEYRVAFRGPNSEPAAYYTTDLQDAVDTATDMAARRTGRLQ
jgi:hypothetical protein